MKQAGMLRVRNEIVFPLAGALIDVSIESNVQNRPVRETPHDGHTKPDQFHLAALIRTAGHAWDRWNGVGADLIRIRTRCRISKYRYRNILVPILFEIAGPFDKGTLEDIGIVDELGNKIR